MGKLDAERASQSRIDTERMTMELSNRDMQFCSVSLRWDGTGCLYFFSRPTDDDLKTVEDLPYITEVKRNKNLDFVLNVKFNSIKLWLALNST